MKEALRGACLLALCLLATPAPVSAKELDLLCLEKVLAAVFKEPKIYTASICRRNAQRLAKHLEREVAGFDLKRAQIWYIRADRSEGKKIYAFEGRTNRVNQKEWSFHYVLEYQGKVLDLDYTDTPTLIDERQYLERMYLGASNAVSDAKRNEILQEIRVTKIPADRFIHEETISVYEEWEFCKFFGCPKLEEVLTRK
jgi:hypothetical protein